MNTQTHGRTESWCRVLVTFLLLWDATMTEAVYKRKRLTGACLHFRGRTYDHHGSEHGSRQGMVLEQWVGAYIRIQKLEAEREPTVMVWVSEIPSDTPPPTRLYLLILKYISRWGASLIQATSADIRWSGPLDGENAAAYRYKEAGFVLYSWTKETGLANLNRMSLCRGVVFRPRIL